jgi:hypothetical protein
MARPSSVLAGAEQNMAVAAGRAKREQKPVERLTAAADEKEEKEFVIQQVWRQRHRH